ncbi:MAG: coenzyme F390 synthetase [Polyangiales bacterium]
MRNEEVTQALVESDALHARVRGVITHGFFGNETFDAVALALASYQARYATGYARLCAARGVDPLRDAPQALPAVPTDAFRLSRVSTFPASHDVAMFRTSGTTDRVRGHHAMRTLETYRLASLTHARSTLFAPFSNPPHIVAIAPSPAFADDSSLSRMLDWFIRDIGASGSCFVDPASIPSIEAALRPSASGARVVVAATAFAYVHLVDALQGRVLKLPRGSRAMQTGGFKGRSREISATALQTAIASQFDLALGDVVGEYGMTELTSQLYATEGARAPDRSEHGTRPSVGSATTPWLYRAPCWVRVTACDASSLRPLPTGSVGIARIEDLANVDSAWAVQTADRVRVHADGLVEVLGRETSAPPRGCSLAVEEWLAASAHSDSSS